MRMQFWQLISWHQYLCNDVYCCHILWQASQCWQVNLCASRLAADHYAIRMIELPTFSQMCPCSLLASAHVTLGGACWIRPQHRHAMSYTPFQGLIWLHFFSGYAPFLSLSPFVVLHIFFDWYPSPSSLVCPHCCCCHHHLSISCTL